MTVVFQKIIEWYMIHVTYWTIALMMTIESTFLPLPSEIVIPPAAWKAANGDLNIFLVIILGTAGAVCGALFNYYFAKLLGNRLLYRFAKTRLARLLMVTPAAIEKSERYFVRNGKISTLIGRLVPGIRHLISLPAGLAGMKLRDFILFTAIGSMSWNIILATMGYFFYTQKELLNRYFSHISIGLLIIGCSYVVYLIFKGIRKKKAKPAEAD
jgi:membrane protein DedA with SNARE-associated domain